MNHKIRQYDSLRVCNVDEEGRFGGPERRIVQVARALKSFGILTHVVFPKMDSKRFEQELVLADVQYTKLDITRLSKESRILLRYFVRFLYEVGLLTSFFRKNHFAVVHVNGAYQFKVAVAGKLSGTPVVWHLNNTLVDPIIKKIFYVIAKICATGFVVAGQRVRKYYLEGRRIEDRPFAEIHAPVDTSTFDPQKIEKDMERETREFYTIATVSGVNPIKGLEYFIEMASRIVARNSNNVKFVVAGAFLTSQQEYTDYILDLISRSALNDTNFEFAGHIKEVPAFLSKADVFVFTSIAEASPTAVWEAMSMSKAIVTTDVGSVRQYIEDGISGFIVPIKDVECLAERVITLIENSNLRKKMGEMARKTAIKKLDLKIAAEKHLEIYKRIVG